MKYFYTLLIVHLIIPTSLSYTMDIDPVVREFPLKGNVRCINYINENRMILNNEKKWILFDPTKDTKIQEQDLAGMQHIAVHPDNNIFAASHRKTVSIYDTETGKSLSKITGNEDIMDSAFGTNTLISRHERSNLLTMYDYKDNFICYKYYAPQNILSFACHPTENKIVLYTQRELSIIDIDKSVKKIVPMPYIAYPSCQYNLDGSLIALGSGQKIYLVNPKNLQYKEIVNPDDDFFTNMIFCPNNNQLLTISKTYGTVRVWDIKTLALLATLTSGIVNSYGNTILLNWQDKELIITLNNKLIKLPIPC